MLNLLHLTSQELQQKIKDELEENPALEAGSDEENENESMDSFSEDEELPEDDYSDFLEQYDDEIPQYKLKDMYAESDEENFFLPNTQHSSFYEKIKEQVYLLNISEKQRSLAEFMIDSLDDDGYLRTDLDELAYQLSFSSREIIDKEDLEEILKLIQSCDPPGIGARSLKECLLLQLSKLNKSCKNAELAYTILSNYTAEMENRNYTKVAKSMNISMDELKETIQYMSKLNPKPNVIADGSINTNHLIPDFIVSLEEGQVCVSLANKNIPVIKLNSKVMEMVETRTSTANKKKRRDEKSAVSFLKTKVNSAKWLVDAIKQRENTMMSVIKAIARIQFEFFSTGDFKNLKPMILKHVAEMAGTDISSVSRVTSNKYVQTNTGTYSLKELFSEGLATHSGELVSNKEILESIKNLLLVENKGNPYTDFQIADLLKDKGYKIARRTVAKYRESLSIPGAKLRRDIV